MRCPRCDLPLEAFALDRATTIDTCARCRGAWFDRGELARKLGTPRDLGDAVPDELPLAAPDAPTCPRCPGVCMLRVPYVVRGNAPSVDLCFGGCAGEVALGALLMLAALVDVPAWPRWSRYRWVALALGACSFVDASLFWREAAKDWDIIPWDAALADTGDMTILRDRYGWSERVITGRYTGLSKLCLAAVLAAWGAAVARARKAFSP